MLTLTLTSWTPMAYYMSEDRPAFLNIIIIYTLLKNQVHSLQTQTAKVFHIVSSSSQMASKADEALANWDGTP